MLRSLSTIARRFSLAAAVVFASAACSDSSGPPDGPQPPGQIVIRSQPTEATVGIPVTQPLIVELQDCWDRLVDTTGAVVTVRVASGNATIQSGNTATTVNGVATFPDLVLVGSTATPVVLRFEIRHRSGVGTTVRSSSPITLVGGNVAAVRAQGPATFSGNVGTAVSPTPVAVVLDGGGNPIAGARVTFKILQGAGKLQDSVVTTDASGLARLGSWTLGLPGVNRIEARVDTAATVFQANATGTVGMLRLSVTGRPDAEPVTVRVLRTTVGSPALDSLVKVLDTTTLVGIPFGTYSVIGDSVNRGSRLWLPKVSYENLAVSTTSGPDVKLEYVEHGRVETTIRGLPVPNQVVPLAVVQQQVTDGITGTLVGRNDAVTRAALPLGVYEVVAPSVTINGQRYAPAPEKQMITVSAGSTAVPVVVQYAIATGSLTVTVNGLPAGATASVDISGPGGFRETVFMSGGRTYTGLAAGTYTVTAAAVQASGRTYTPDASPKTAEVSAGTTATVTFTYTAP